MNIARHLLVAMLASAAIDARAAPLEMPTGSGPPCLPISNGFSVLDFSMNVTPLKLNNTPVLDLLKNDFKVDTIFRYYDYPESETTTGKTLRKTESDAILAAGYKIGTIFQHYNNNPAKFFEPGIGAKDAQQALIMAEENRQPYDTVIYFGVDGPEDNFGPLQAEYALDRGPMSQARIDELKRANKFALIKYYDLYVRYGQQKLGISDLGPTAKLKPEMLYDVIDEYFKEVEATFKADRDQHGGGYKIGMYCTAVMCAVGERRGIQRIWLSPEGRLGQDYKDFFKTLTKVVMIQWPDTSCQYWSGAPKGEVAGFDFNQVNDRNSDLGTWDQKRSN
jgi:hypothetical protein